MSVSIVQYPRALRPELLQALAVYPVVAVLGARQVGKSTLGMDIASTRGMAYRTLDDRDVLRQATEDPEGLLAELGDAGFIDEAQRAPDLFLALKAVVDRRQRPGRYLLSGSNQPTMARAIADSLLGRAAYRRLRPLTLSELRLEETHGGWDFLFHASAAHVLAELERRASASGALDWRVVAKTGGFPRAVAVSGEHRQRLLGEYIDVLAHRDIRELIAVESSERFGQFIRLVAARTGQVLNVNRLSTDLGIPVNTARRWLGALERSFLVELVPAYSRNPGHRVTKAPKLFMVDVALALAAAQESEPTGLHLETLVASDLMVWRDGAPDRGVFHWRTQSGQEVDFVAGLGGQLLPVEVKAANRVGDGDARYLRTFLERYAGGIRGLIVSADPEIRELRGRVVAAPWWAVL